MAQWKSVRFTRGRSLVRSQPGPPRLTSQTRYESEETITDSALTAADEQLVLTARVFINPALTRHWVSIRVCPAPCRSALRCRWRDGGGSSRCRCVSASAGSLSLLEAKASIPDSISPAAPIQLPAERPLPRCAGCARLGEVALRTFPARFASQEDPALLSRSTCQVQTEALQKIFHALARVHK